MSIFSFGHYFEFQFYWCSRSTMNVERQKWMPYLRINALVHSWNDCCKLTIGKKLRNNKTICLTSVCMVWRNQMSFVPSDAFGGYASKNTYRYLRSEQNTSQRISTVLLLISVSFSIACECVCVRFLRLSHASRIGQKRRNSSVYVGTLARTHTNTVVADVMYRNFSDDLFIACSILMYEIPSWCDKQSTMYGWSSPFN